MLKSRKLFIISCLVMLIAILVSDVAYAKVNVFKDLSVNTTNFAWGLRNFAYVFSGFGIIMFTFLAICGKINFKHLGYIVICLFFLSAVGALIDYIVGNPAKTQLTASFGTAYTKAACNSTVCRGSGGVGATIRQ